MELQENPLKNVHSMYMLDPGGDKSIVSNRSKQDMVVLNKYKRSQLEGMRVTQLRKLAHEAKLHGVAVAGATKAQLIEGILSGKLDVRDKLTKAMAELLEIVVDAVEARMRQKQD